MGIRIHELAKELGAASKTLVAVCKALHEKGALAKDVSTASSSLDARDEAVVRSEFASGSDLIKAAAESAGEKPAFKLAQEADALGGIQLMQSHATKPKDRAPQQLTRPEAPPRPAPPPKPEPAPEPQPEAKPEPDPPASTAEVKIAALPGVEPSKPSKPPEPEAPEPEAEVPAVAEPPADVAQVPEAKPEAKPEPEVVPEPAEVAPPEEPKKPAKPAKPKKPRKPKKATKVEKAAKEKPAKEKPAGEPESSTSGPAKVATPPIPPKTSPPQPPQPPHPPQPPQASGVRTKVSPSPQAPMTPIAPRPRRVQDISVMGPIKRELRPEDFPELNVGGLVKEAPKEPEKPVRTAEKKPEATYDDEPVKGKKGKGKKAGLKGKLKTPSRVTHGAPEDADMDMLPGKLRARGKPRPGTRRRSERLRPIPKTGAARPKTVKKDTKITITPPISIKDLSQEMGIKAGDIIRKMMMDLGTMVIINELVDADAAEALCMEFGFEVEIQKAQDAEDTLQRMIEDEGEDKPEDLTLRPPIVTLLGHVDHGKTSLLDRIRKTNVAEGESGGITQHVGAYQVSVGDRSVTFLDTPGHAAFTAMRARGANCTDVVVLVVAADDGVMPQTEEAINHARAAGVPIVVAINKCDKPNANPMRTKQQLAALGLNPEEWGGDTVTAEVSAITGQGVDELLEVLALEAELLELKGNVKRRARGVVIEAEISTGRGVEATLLVQDGTLKPGDTVLCGQGFGRIRSIVSDQGKLLDSAGPAMPVLVSGLSAVPEAGDRFYVVDDLQAAREIAAERERHARMESLTARQHVTLENLFERIELGKVKEVRVVLKADVQGSVEVLRNSLIDLSTDEVKVNILHSAVGGISESDVLLADASDAIVIGFHVTPEDRARSLAEDKGVDIRMYNVIYMAIEDVKMAMEGMLDPEEREEVVGHAEVLRIFRVSRFGTIAGCVVRDGLINRSARLRLIRDSVVIYDGKMHSLRHEKDDIREARAGQECGIKIEGYDDVKEGDMIETYVVRQIARTIDGS